MLRPECANRLVDGPGGDAIGLTRILGLALFGSRGVGRPRAHGIDGGSLRRLVFRPGVVGAEVLGPDLAADLVEQLVHAEEEAGPVGDHLGGGVGLPVFLLVPWSFVLVLTAPLVVLGLREEGLADRR